MLLVVMASCAGAARSSPAPAPQPPPPKTQIVILGTGTPVADPDRSGPSVAIVTNDTSYVIDAGPGLVRRAAATGIPALKVRNMKRVFITHLHSDHTLGYPDLLLGGAVLHRQTKLEAWGPHGLREMTDHILAAWKKDIDVRVNGLEHGDAAAYAADVHEIAPGEIYEDANVTVRAFLVKHGSWDEAFGYRFDTSDHRSIVFSGDTGPAESIVEACNGCDVLVHEVYARAGFDKLPADDKNYHSKFHTSSIELSSIATRAKAKTLVLHHQLFFGATEQTLIEEVKRGFSGTVISAKDLQIL